MRALASNKRRAVLLASASAGGTIAAVRHLGQSGFDVRAITSRRRLGAAAWSRYVDYSCAAPVEHDNARFLTQLLSLGRADPGQILLAASDETAWLYTTHSTILDRSFVVYQPSITTMRRILDKRLLAEAAAVAGLAVLPFWDPLNTDDLASLAPRLEYPILIKPRTHVHRVRNDKGVVVRSAEKLIEAYQQFLAAEQSSVPVDDPLMPDARRPLLQRFVDVSSEGVLSVSGFIDRKQQLFVTRCSTKVFQRSHPVGVGVCYKSVPPVEGLLDAIWQLCLDLEYFGIFEVEFVRHNGDWAAIDFNPRLFNQIALDIHRGMPLPLLACLDATNETPALREAVTKAQAWTEGSPVVLYDSFTLNAILLAGTLTGRISRQEDRYWRGWVRQHASIDIAQDASDPIPGLIHGFSEIALGLKAIPRFLQSTPRASSVALEYQIKLPP